MSDEEEEDVMLKPGTIVDSNKTKYKIDKLLGEGGFGAVYKVVDMAPPSAMVKLDKDKKALTVYYAMKVEKKIETRVHSKLKMEIAILKLIHQLQTKEGKDRLIANHFTSIVDRGKKDTYFFLVMELVGKSLADLKVPFSYHFTLLVSGGNSVVVKQSHAVPNCSSSIPRMVDLFCFLCNYLIVIHFPESGKQQKTILTPYNFVSIIYLSLSGSPEGQGLQPVHGSRLQYAMSRSVRRFA